MIPGFHLVVFISFILRVSNVSKQELNTKQVHTSCMIKQGWKTILNGVVSVVWLLDGKPDNIIRFHYYVELKEKA